MPEAERAFAMRQEAASVGLSLVRGSRARIRESIATRRDAIFRRLLIAADLFAAGVSLLIVVQIHGGSFHFNTLLLLPLVVVFAKLTGRYDHDEVVLRKSTLDEIPQLVTLAALSAVAWALIAEWTAPGVGRVGVGTMWLITATALVVGRSCSRWLAARLAPAERILIVGDSTERAQLADRMASDPFARTEIVGSLPLQDQRRRAAAFVPDRRRHHLALADLEKLVKGRWVERVFLIPGENKELTHEAVSRANATGVKVSIFPSLFDVVGSAVELDEIGGLAVLSQRRPGLSRSSMAVKRATDVVVSLIALMLLSPGVLVIAILIKLDSPGPVLFRQQRVGRRGNVFMMIKFRTMVDGAEASRHALSDRNETEGLFKLASDPRVTRVGRWLRRTSIDEVTQLINVLRGEMSLVGPRPLVIDEDRLVMGKDRVRLDLSPGMTGPWQVLGPKRPPLGEMVKIDYLYAADWSLWNDIKIMVRTVMHMTGLRGI